MIICELKLLDDDSWQDRIQEKMDKMNPVVISVTNFSVLFMLSYEISSEGLGDYDKVQGNPLPTYFFVIAMEAFDSLLLESQVTVLFWVSSLGERGGSEEISPLLFVDDY